jgi:hypothetical protein
MIVMRKRRNERKAAKLARLLLSLDDAARETRSWRPRRTQLVALGAGAGPRHTP